MKQNTISRYVFSFCIMVFRASPILPIFMAIMNQIWMQVFVKHFTSEQISDKNLYSHVHTCHFKEKDACKLDTVVLFEKLT